MRGQYSGLNRQLRCVTQRRLLTRERVKVVLASDNHFRVAQQLVGARPFDEVPVFLVRDGDPFYGQRSSQRARHDRCSYFRHRLPTIGGRGFSVSLCERAAEVTGVCKPSVRGDLLDRLV